MAETFSHRWNLRIESAVRWVEQQRLILRTQKGRNRAIPVPTERWCELTAQLTPTASGSQGTASAKRLKWDVTASEWIDAEEDDFTVQIRDSDAWGITGERGLVIARQSDNGVVWETRSQFGQDTYQAKMDEALDAGDSGVASIWTGTTLADSTENWTVYAPEVLPTGSIASGDWVHVKWFRTERKFIGVGAEC